jgi:hypothetical protein
MLDVKIKEWKKITKEEKLDLDYMVKMRELYALHKHGYETDDDYIKIADTVTTLRIKLEKAVEVLEEKQRKLNDRQLKLNSSLLDIQEIITTYNIWQTGSGNLSWYLQELHENEFGEREWTCLKKETLQGRFPQLSVHIRGGAGQPDYSSFKEFTEIMVKEDRIFNKLVQSWTKKTGNGTLNILFQGFCKPQETTDYHWIIDAAFESISGGTGADKKDHLEDIIWAKFLHPENIFIPSIFLNDEGSSGKGAFVARFLTRLFGGAVADNCNIEHLTGKFNGVIAGKAIIFINETARDKVDVEKVKSFIGSPTFMVEEKYEKPYACDNTGLVISATNQKTGGITLSGENSDRRYSIFSTKTDIYQVIIKYFLAKEGKTLTRAEATDWLEETGQHILHDEVEVGKWIAHKLISRGDIRSVRAIHADEYKHLLNRQRGAWTQTVEQLFNEPGFDYIRAALLRDLVLHYNKGEVIPGRNKMNEEIVRLCKDKGIQVVYHENVTIKNVNGSIQKNCWKVDNGKGTVNEDESKYGEIGSKGFWEWRWIA